MSERWCSREPEVLRAVAREWRDPPDAHVAAHVVECPRCAEVRAAAELLRVHHVRELQASRVPSPAAMWWRLERRIREERARRLQRIALATQAVVLAAAAGGAAAVLQIVTPWIGSTGLGSSSFGSSVAEGTWQAVTVMLATWAQAASAWTIPIAIGAGAWALLVPAALYLGLAGE